MKKQKRLLAILLSILLTFSCFGTSIVFTAGAVSSADIFSNGTLSDNFDGENYNAADYWEQIGLPAYIPINTEANKTAFTSAYPAAQTATTQASYEGAGNALALASYSNVHEIEGAMRFSTYAPKYYPENRKVIKQSGDITFLAVNNQYIAPIIVYYYEDAYNWRGIGLFEGYARLMASFTETSDSSTTVYTCNLVGTNKSYASKATLAVNDTVHFELSYADDGKSVTLNLTKGETALVKDWSISKTISNTSFKSYVLSEWTTETDLRSSATTTKKSPSINLNGLNATNKVAISVAGGAVVMATLDNVKIEFEKTASDFNAQYADLKAVTIDTAGANIDKINEAIACYDSMSDTEKADADATAIYNHIVSIKEQLEYAPLMTSATISTNGDRIRFASTLQKLKENGIIEEYGTLFTYAAYITNGSVAYSDMVAGTTNKYVAVAKSTDVSGLTAEGDVFYGGSFTIAPEYYGYRIVARSYIKYTDGSVYYSLNNVEDANGGTLVTDGVKNGFATRSIVSISKKILGTVYSNKDNTAVTMDETLKTEITNYISGMEGNKITWTNAAKGEDNTGKPIVDFITGNAEVITAALNSILAQG